MRQNFKIIVACRNVEKWITYSMESLIGQTYKNWQAIVIDDCSSDQTPNLLKELSVREKRFTIIRNSQPLVKMQNYVTAVKISQPEDEDVLVFLDGDDWLPDSNVFEYLVDVYKNDDVWLTLGSYVVNSGKNPSLLTNYEGRGTGGYARELPLDQNVRKDWRFSHLKTCKYFLWKNIKDVDIRLKVTGEYYPSAIDTAIMYPMIEMAGREHHKFIERITYVYNCGNPQSYMYTLRQVNQKCCAETRSCPPYAQKTKDELLHGVSG